MNYGYYYVKFKLHITSGSKASRGVQNCTPNSRNSMCSDTPGMVSWIINHQNYSNTDIIDILPKINRTNGISSIEDWPAFPKGQLVKHNVDRGDIEQVISPSISNTIRYLNLSRKILSFASENKHSKLNW